MASDASKEGASAAAPGPTPPPQRSAPKPRPSKQRIGRRLYDPRADETGAVRASAEGDPARAAAGDPRRGWKKGARKPGAPKRPPVTKEKQTTRADAQALAKDKGIPLVHAYRIVKGQATLNQVLKGMMRKERFEQLVRREGIDRELAGQVASGHLPKKRAIVLTRMRTLREEKLHVDAINHAAKHAEEVAIDVFGAGWVTGRVREARAYDFDFLAAGHEAPKTHFKHDIKAICAVSELRAVRAATTIDEAVQAEGLGGTESREARVRPEDEWMLQLAEDERIARFTMRDGEAFLGKIRSFGRWDAELVLPGGETVGVFFHALHPTSARLGHAA